MSAARFLPYAASLLLDFAYAIIAVCALSRNTWASPLRTLACLLLCVLLVASTWWQSRLEAPSGAIQRSCVIAAAGSALSSSAPWFSHRGRSSRPERPSWRPGASVRSTPGCGATSRIPTCPAALIGSTETASRSYVSTALVDSLPMTDRLR